MMLVIPTGSTLWCRLIVTLDDGVDHIAIKCIDGAMLATDSASQHQ